MVAKEILLEGAELPQLIAPPDHIVRCTLKALVLEEPADEQLVAFLPHVDEPGAALLAGRQHLPEHQPSRDYDPAVRVDSGQAIFQLLDLGLALARNGCGGAEADSAEECDDGQHGHGEAPVCGHGAMTAVNGYSPLCFLEEFTG